MDGIDLVVFAGVFFGAFVAGFAGFGLAAASGAFLLQVLDPEVAVPLMMFCSVLVQLAGMLYLRADLDLRSAAPFVLGGALGVPIAVVIFDRIDAALFQTIFGAFLVVYAIWTLGTVLRPTPALAGPGGLAAAEVPRRGAWFAGWLGGLIGGLTAMPGVVLSVWFERRGLAKARQRAIVQPFILCMQVLALTLAWKTLELDDRLTEVLAWTLPAVVAGTVLGLALYRRAKPKAFRLAVLAIIFASGASLTVG